MLMKSRLYMGSCRSAASSSLSVSQKVGSSLTPYFLPFISFGVAPAVPAVAGLQSFFREPPLFLRHFVFRKGIGLQAGDEKVAASAHVGVVVSQERSRVPDWTSL